MRFLEIFFPVNMRRQMAELATEIARRCQPAAVAVVGERIRQIGIAEARGYIRARSRRVVENEIDELILTAPAIRNVPRGPLVERDARAYHRVGHRREREEFAANRADAASSMRRPSPRSFFCKAERGVRSRYAAAM